MEQADAQSRALNGVETDDDVAKTNGTAQASDYSVPFTPPATPSEAIRVPTSEKRKSWSSMKMNSFPRRVHWVRRTASGTDTYAPDLADTESDEDCADGDAAALMQSLSLRGRTTKQRSPSSSCIDGAASFPQAETSNVRIQALLERADKRDFNVFELNRATDGKPLRWLALHLFEAHGLVRAFRLDLTRFCKFLLEIENSYHDNPYHNVIHACDVVQMMHYLLLQPRVRQVLSEREVFACLLACVVHDVDHPGVTNGYLTSTENALALLHGDTSTLERHHTQTARGILARNESNIYSTIDADDRAAIERLVESLVLATDMKCHSKFLQAFQGRFGDGAGDKGARPQEGLSDADRLLLMQILMKCADISNACRPWMLCKEWAGRILEEFFSQGDKERQHNMTISFNCDRATVDIPSSQVGFIRAMVEPLYASLAGFVESPAMAQLLAELRSNADQWERKRRHYEKDCAKKPLGSSKSATL